MRRFFRKSIFVPDGSVTLEAIQLWEVRWKSRHGEGYYDVRPEVEAFPSLKEADRFADALREAFALMKHTSGACVTVERATL